MSYLLNIILLEKIGPTRGRAKKALNYARTQSINKQ